MILEQPLLVYESILIMAFTIILLFIYRVFVFNKKFYGNLYILPSIIVFGPESHWKNKFVEKLSKTKVLQHPSESLNLSYNYHNGKKFQIISVSNIPDMIDRFKKILYLVYFFDPQSNKINQEIEDLKRFESIKPDIKHIIIIPQKAEGTTRIDTETENIQKISLSNEEDIEEVRDSLLSDIIFS